MSRKQSVVVTIKMNECSMHPRPIFFVKLSEKKSMLSQAVSKRKREDVDIGADERLVADDMIGYVDDNNADANEEEEKSIVGVNLARYVQVKRLRHDSGSSGGVGDERFECDIDGCGMSCLTERRLSSHYKSRHDIARSLVYECDADECRQQFAKKCVLEWHMWYVHEHSVDPSRFKLWPCSVVGCGSRSYKRKQDLDTHMWRVHDVNVDLKFQSFVCTADGCGIVVKTKAELRSHLSFVHERTPGSFVCDQPGCSGAKFFKQRSDLDKHLWQVHCVNTGGKFHEWPCTFSGCPHVSRRKSHLTDHVRRRHGSSSSGSSNNGNDNHNDHDD